MTVVTSIRLYEVENVGVLVRSPYPPSRIVDPDESIEAVVRSEPLLGRGAVERYSRGVGLRTL